MRRRRKPFFQLRADGDFDLNVPEEVRSLLVAMADNLEQIVSLDVPDTKRLFPTAYPDDPERDAGYQVFARDQLVEQRLQAAKEVRDTAGLNRLSADQLSTWMGVVNDGRLVLGTQLDVSEDSDIDWDSADLELHLLYHNLGVVLQEIVEAMMGTLPEDGDDSMAPGLS